MIFLTLFLGFLDLTIKEFAGTQVIGKAAAWVLIVCAFSAWYNMAHVIFAEVDIKLPVGGPWIE